MPDWSRGVCIVHGGQCLLLMSVFFLSSDQILSITPTTKEQVDILKNVSTQYEVWDSTFIRDWVGVFFCPPVNHYLKCFLPDSLMAAGRTSVHQRRDWGPPVCTCQQLRDRRRPAAETRHHSWVRCRPDSYGSSLLPNLEKEKMDKSRLLDYNVTRLSQ